MKKCILLSMIAIFFFLVLFINQKAVAQKIKVESVIETMRIEDNLSLDVCKGKLLEAARVKAVVQAFGEVVMQGNAMYVRNVQNGLVVKSETVFDEISNTYLNGQWLQDIGSPEYTKTTKNNEDWLEIKLKCKVSELPKNEIDFDVKTLSCPEVNCKTDVFNDGQDFYVLFKSPVDGYLTIYLEVPQEKMSYRIFPYKSCNSATSLQIKGDVEYVLFSDKINKLNPKIKVDNLLLSLTDSLIAEQNALVVLFSTEEIKDKPMLQNNDYTTQLPMSVSIRDFEHWIINTRRKNKNLSFSKSYISINPK